MKGEDIFIAIGEAEDRFVSAPSAVREKAEGRGVRRRAAIAALVAAAILLLAGSVFAATNLGAKLTKNGKDQNGLDSISIEAPIQKTPMGFIGDRLKTIVDFRERYYGENSVSFTTDTIEAAVDIIGCDMLRVADMGCNETCVDVYVSTTKRGISCIRADVNYYAPGILKLVAGYCIFTENSEADEYKTTYYYKDDLNFTSGEASGKWNGKSWCDWTARGLQCLVVEEAPRANGRTNMRCVVVSGSIVYELNLTFFSDHRGKALDLLALWLGQL